MGFNPQIIGSRFIATDKSVTIPAGGSSPMVPANPNRIALTFGLVTGTAIVGISNKVTAAVGYPISGATQPLSIGFSDHPALVQQAWVGFSAAGATVYIIEEVQNPNAET